jgi:hypothetical protein
MGNLPRRMRERKARLASRGITQERIAREVERLFPDRTCTKQMVNSVVNGRAVSAYVVAAIEHLLQNGRPKRANASTALTPQS